MTWKLLACIATLAALGCGQSRTVLQTSDAGTDTAISADSGSSLDTSTGADAPSADIARTDVVVGECEPRVLDEEGIFVYQASSDRAPHLLWTDSVFALAMEDHFTRHDTPEMGVQFINEDATLGPRYEFYGFSWGIDGYTDRYAYRRLVRAFAGSGQVAVVFEGEDKRTSETVFVASTIGRSNATHAAWQPFPTGRLSDAAVLPGFDFVFAVTDESESSSRPGLYDNPRILTTYPAGIRDSEAIQDFAGPGFSPVGDLRVGVAEGTPYATYLSVVDFPPTLMFEREGMAEFAVRGGRAGAHQFALDRNGDRVALLKPEAGSSDRRTRLVSSAGEGWSVDLYPLGNATTMHVHGNVIGVVAHTSNLYSPEVFFFDLSGNPLGSTPVRVRGARVLEGNLDITARDERSWAIAATSPEDGEFRPELSTHGAHIVRLELCPE